MIRVLTRVPLYQLSRKLGWPPILPLNLTITPSPRCNSRCVTCNRIARQRFRGISKVTQAPRVEDYRLVKAISAQQTQGIPRYAGWIAALFYLALTQHLDSAGASPGWHFSSCPAC